MDEQKNNASDGNEATEFKPGDTVSPRQENHVTESTSEPDPSSNEAVVEPTAPAATDVPEATPIGASSDGFQSAPIPTDTEEPAITWTASEFIAHNKTALWYICLALLVALIAVIIFLLTRDMISTAVIVIAGIALGGYGARKPRQLQYALSGNGLLIANKYFPFETFRSFAVLDEGAFDSIVFVPLRRFGQLITIYFDPADEERIIDLLSTRLPLEHRTHDMVDQLMRRIRF